MLSCPQAFIFSGTFHDCWDLAFKGRPENVSAWGFYTIWCWLTGLAFLFIEHLPCARLCALPSRSLQPNESWPEHVILKDLATSGRIEQRVTGEEEGGVWEVDVPRAGLHWSVFDWRSWGLLLLDGPLSCLSTEAWFSVPSSCYPWVS